MLPSSAGRESDGRPSYPYITGFLQGTLKTAIRQIEGGTDPFETRDYLQAAFDQTEIWTDPYDSPKKDGRKTDEDKRPTQE